MRNLRNPLLPLGMMSYVSFAAVTAALLGGWRFFTYCIISMMVFSIWSGLALWLERRAWRTHSSCRTYNPTWTIR